MFKDYLLFPHSFLNYVKKKKSNNKDLQDINRVAVEDPCTHDYGQFIKT